jgi:HAD superfamily hydrolase (TIGR01662 family)
LARLLEALGRAESPLPGRILIVDDRADAATTLAEGTVSRLAPRLRVLRSGSRGPAAARNLGWRAGSAPWVAFLDDDVLPDPDWLIRLQEDLQGAGPGIGGVQGRIHVPLPRHRRATDWERNVAGLEGAHWITADMAYRREALERVGGFDERFPRAYREDADLGLRVTAAGYRILRGTRRMQHPVRPAGPWVSVRLQRGNADDALMLALHGWSWRRAAGVPRGARPLHLALSASGLVGLVGVLARRPVLAMVAIGGWAAGTADLVRRRIAPGPRTPREIATMLLSSLAIPPAATVHWFVGLGRAARLRSGPGPVPRVGHGPQPVEAVLFDRDGTLVTDVPYNGDPALVELLPDARRSVERLREGGIRVGVVSNQSGVGRGLITTDQVERVNRRVEELLGPFDVWGVCPHGPQAGCSCRKPAPGMVLEAMGALGARPSRTVLVGDTGADVEAGRRAGVRVILVPNAVTRVDEIVSAPEIASDLEVVADRILAGGR